jgi:hypothetical protein
MNRSNEMAQQPGPHSPGCALGRGGDDCPEETMAKLAPGTGPAAAAAGTVARRRWKGEEKWGGMRTEMEGG